MNIFKIIQDIEQVDPEVYQRLNSRRSAFNLIGKAALAAAPLALASVFQKAYGKTNEDVNAILNYALTLEYLENEFYATGLNTSGLIPATYKAAFTQIGKHEAQHVALLKSVLMTNAVAKPTFDFTAGNNFPTVFSDFATFATLAQAFEDTGVRAYKGRAGELLGTDTLTVALQIHSVEARHASYVRRLRMQKGWITGNDGGGIPTAAAASYAGEENTTQGGLTKDKFVGSYTDAQLTEAFDEPLTKDQVLAIAGLFIKK